MIVHVFDKILNLIGVIDDYDSLVWATRYQVCGDFEMVLPISYSGSPLLLFGHFLTIEASNVVMIIEDSLPSTNEYESTLTITGESSESLLKRRFTIELTNVDDLIENVVYDLMEKHITNPEVSDWGNGLARHMPIFKDTFPPISAAIAIEDQLPIQSIYDSIASIVKAEGFGFRIIKENNKLAFWLYNGTDRSYGQSAVPVVMFSDNFDNVLSSSFYTSQKGLINIVQVIGDDEVYPSEPIWEFGKGEPSGLDRFEGVLEEIVERDNDTPSLNDEQILAIIETKGREVITDNKPVDILQGDFDFYSTFTYKVDFWMGDIVQCDIEGRDIKARIIEVVRSYSSDGKTSYVAFDFIDPS